MNQSIHQSISPSICPSLPLQYSRIYPSMLCLSSSSSSMHLRTNLSSYIYIIRVCIYVSMYRSIPQPVSQPASQSVVSRESVCPSVLWSTSRYRCLCICIYLFCMYVTHLLYPSRSFRLRCLLVSLQQVYLSCICSV